MSKPSLTLKVQTRTTKGTSTRELCFEQDQLVVQDVFDILAQQEWAADLFATTEAPVRLQPGFMIVLNQRMIQPWEFGSYPIRDGQELQFIQVVPGG